MALGALGSGWTPMMRLSLIDSSFHQGADREPVALAYKVFRREKRLTENSVYLRKMPDSIVKRSDRYEDLFEDLLTEEHPKRRFEKKSVTVSAPRNRLVWAALERYEPRNPDQLASSRVFRERNKADRAERKYAEETPLYAMIDQAEERWR